MKASLPWLLLGMAFSLVPVRAVENGTNSSFNTTAPTGSDILNWNLGWTQPSGQSGVTGWNYVGTVAGGGGSASGVYLGNNWVVTAGHVGPGTFTLGGLQYFVVSGSAQSISNSNGTADLSLFQISTAPNLPSLSIATLAPVPFNSSVAMIGYGDGGALTHETWGLNTVTQTNQLVGVDSFVSSDFVTGYGGQPVGTPVVTNNYLVALGDSGGGDFIFNSSSQKWQLAGLNEAVGTAGDGNNDTNYSYLVQLSTYSTQINSIVATPEPSSGAFLACGLLAAVGNCRLFRQRQSRGCGRVTVQRPRVPNQA